MVINLLSLVGGRNFITRQLAKTKGNSHILRYSVQSHASCCHWTREATWYDSKFQCNWSKKSSQGTGRSSVLDDCLQPCLKCYCAMLLRQCSALHRGQCLPAPQASFPASGDGARVLRRCWGWPPWHGKRSGGSAAPWKDPPKLQRVRHDCQNGSDELQQSCENWKVSPVHTAKLLLMDFHRRAPQKGWQPWMS